MPAEHVDIGIEIIEREQNQAETASFARCNCPVMLQNLAKSPAIKQSGDGVVARQIPNAAFRVEQGVVHITSGNSAGSRSATPESYIETHIRLARQRQRSQCEEVFTPTDLNRETGFLFRPHRLGDLQRQLPANQLLYDIGEWPVARVLAANGLKSRIAQCYRPVRVINPNDDKRLGDALITCSRILRFIDGI